MNTGRAFSLLAFVVLVSACAGAADSPSTTQTGSSSAAATTFSSDDDVLTVVVPEGSLPEGVTIAPSDSSELPDLLSTSGLTMFTYELGPDGSEFDDPVEVTYRIPVSEMPTTSVSGIPWVLLVGVTSDGQMDLYETIDISREGDDVVVTGTTKHFSKTVAVVGDVEITLVSVPDPVSLPVGAAFQVFVDNEAGLDSLVRKGDYADGFVRITYGSRSPVTFLTKVDRAGQYECTSESNGAVPDAFTADVQLFPDNSGSTIYVSDVLRGLVGSDLARVYGALLGAETHQYVIARLAGDAECTASEDGSTTSIGPSTTLPQGFPGVNINDFEYKFSSHHFTVTVDGDGEAITKLDTLQWYQAIITAETPDGPINMDYTFAPAGEQGRLFDPNSGGLLDSETTAEWLDPSTLIINMASDAYPSAATSVEIELLVRFIDENGEQQDYFSSATWQQP